MSPVSRISETAVDSGLHNQKKIYTYLFSGLSRTSREIVERYMDPALYISISLTDLPISTTQKKRASIALIPLVSRKIRDIN